MKFIDCPHKFDHIAEQNVIGSARTACLCLSMLFLFCFLLFTCCDLTLDVLDNIFTLVCYFYPHEDSFCSSFYRQVLVI